jgi:predicted Zn-dependent protease
MKTIRELEKAAEAGLKRALAAPDVEEAEVFVSENGTLITRLNYTSHIPSNGLEEPKSVENLGVGIRAVFKGSDGRRNGFGSESSDISAPAVDEALRKAREGAVADPDFVSLPKPQPGERPTLANYHDERLMSISADHLVDAGWRTLEGALDVFESSEELLGLAAGDRSKLAGLGLILGGDVTMLQERMAIASSQMPKPQSDQSTLVMSFTTAMIESRAAKGGGCVVGTSIETDFAQAGRQAARGAIASVNGKRVPSGQYDVIFGPQAITDIFHNLVIPGLSLELFYAGATPFAGKFGQRIAASGFNVYDDGATRGLAASKRITCEGLPTGRTDLIRDGELVGLLSNDYEFQRILRDKGAAEKLGADPRQHQLAIAPRNGFRFGRGGGRHFDSSPGVSATNVVVESSVRENREDLLGKVKNGLYIGRIWYTYPVNGFSTGDFTCTVIGDSFVIRDGKLAEAIKPNSLRINHNTHKVLQNVIGVTAERQGTILWAADQIVYAPEVAVRGVSIDEIAGYMESV